MRKISRTKKIVIGTAAATALAVGGGIAFAYWTTSGSGTGTATAGSAQAVTLHSVFAGNLAPGQSQALTITADGNGQSDVQIPDLYTKVSTDKVGCAGSVNFSVTGLTPNNATVHKADSGVTVGSGTLNFLETGSNQNACQGAVITVDVQTTPFS
jgi:hypothetical protein